MPRMPVMPSPFVVRSEISGTQVTIFLAGKADLVSIDELQNSLNRVSARRPKRLVFDLSGLETIWSLVLGAMVACARIILRHGGTVEIRGASGLVRNVLLTCRLNEVFAGLRDDDAASTGGAPSLN